MLFKWSKIDNQDVRKAIIIDSTGTIFLNNQITSQKINLNTFTKSINDYVSKEKMEKNDANNDPPKRASIPNNNEQNIFVAVFFLNDFHKDKDFRNKTNYMWRKTGLKIDEANYAIYNFLNKSDLETIKKAFD